MSGVIQMLLAGVKKAVVDPFFNYVTLLLPGNGANGAQNNTFVDGSTNNFTITRNGNTTQGTFSPFSQTGWGNYFDGSGDYLSGIGTVSDFNFMHQSSALFTFECWVYLPSPSTNQYILDNCDGSTAQIGVLIGVESSKLYLAINRGASGTSVASGSSTGNVPANQWVHIAITYDQSLGSSNGKFYINGVASGAVNKTANAPSGSDASNAMRVGAYASGSGPVTGYISNLRISNSIVYSSAFTPPTTPLTAIANTELLTCQSNRFIDNSTNAFAITANGDVSVQAFSPFNPTAAWSAATNGGSGYFDGTGDYLTTASSTSLALGSGDFTVDVWFYPTTTNTYFPIDFRTGCTLYFYVTSGTTVNVAIGGNSETTFTGVVTNAWNHFACVRSGSGSNNVSYYLNGVRGAQQTDTTNFSSATTVTLGKRYIAFGGNEFYFAGYLGSTRLVVGTAVYSGATYTVPTAPLTAIANTQLLCNFTNAGIYDATAKNDLETVGNAQISTTQSKFGGSSMYFDGTGDYLTSPANPLCRLMGGDFTVEMWVRLAASQSNVGLVSSYSSNTGWIVRLDTTTVVFAYGTGTSATVVSNSASLSTGVWHHIAWTKSGTTLRSFVDGTQVGSNHTVSSAVDTANTGLQVGRTHTVTNDLNGFINDLRITKGIARYTAAFTPPTTAFPTL